MAGDFSRNDGLGHNGNLAQCGSWRTLTCSDFGRRVCAMADFLFSPKYSTYRKYDSSYNGNVYGRRHCHQLCPNNVRVNTSIVENFDGDRYYPLVRSADVSCYGYEDLTGVDAGNDRPSEWSLAHILRSVLISQCVKPPLLQSRGSNELVSKLVASTEFGKLFENRLSELERHFVSRAELARASQEGTAGCSFFTSSCLVPEGYGVSFLGCCPFLPVPDNACPDHTMWLPVIVQLLSYSRSDRLSWKKIVFLWRILGLCMAFTSGHSEFLVMHNKVVMLKQHYVRWKSMELLFQSGKCNFHGISGMVSEAFESMCTIDADLIFLHEFWDTTRHS